MIKPFQFISSKDMEDFKSIQLKYPYKRGISLQAHISDIHFGVMEAELEYKILKEQFIDRIRDLPLDLISIDGDLFNKLDMSNSDAVLYANLFVSDLVNLCKANRIRGVYTTLLILMGTKNHDSGQLRLFYHYINDPDIDIRIVENIQFEYINGLKVLCIPELYGIPEEEYNKFLWQSDQYDMCFMHGTVQGAVYGDNAGESRLFRPQDFGSCLGPVIAGHVHPGGCYHSFIYYNGSPIRWCFGEEGPKGFQLVLYDMDTRKHYVYLEQIKSFRYDTISIDELLMSDPKDVIAYINALKEKENIDYLRLKCKISDSNQDAIKLLQEYYRTNKTIKFKLEKILSPDEQNLTQANIELQQQYSYLFDKSMSPYDILARFISDNEEDMIIRGDEILNVLRET